MILPTDKLNQHIDQLVIWLRENKNVKILTSQKVRLTNITNAILNSATLSEEELKTLKTEIPKSITSTNSSPSAGYINCENCGDRLNVNNIGKHKNKCRANKNKPKQKAPIAPKLKRKKTNSGISTDKSSFNERKEEKKLDGARDYWQLRDQGKFGSHSSYDDMGDEAFS